MNRDNSNFVQFAMQLEYKVWTKLCYRAHGTCKENERGGRELHTESDYK